MEFHYNIKVVKYDSLAQLVEHLTFNPVVRGSNPRWVTKMLRLPCKRKRTFLFADVAKLADALDLGSSGKPWGFKSLHPHQ